MTEEIHSQTPGRDCEESGTVSPRPKPMARVTPHQLAMTQGLPCWSFS